MSNRISARRLIGTALLVSGLVLGGLAMFGFAPSSAAPPKEQCWRWGIQEMSVTTAGPGAVTVDGSAVAEKMDATSHCRRNVEVVGYRLDGTRLSSDYVTGPAFPFWDTGDRFTKRLSVPVGADAVCLRTEMGTHVGCFAVEVQVGGDGLPRPPIVGDQIPFGQPPTGEGDGPIDVCGHCV